MATAVSEIPRFYATNILVGYSQNAYTTFNSNTFALTIDRATAPAPASVGCASSITPSYTFIPNIFGLNTTYVNNYASKVPVYFDYYTYYALSTSNMINDSPKPPSSNRLRNGNLINSLFVLDNNNIQHYISPVTGSSGALLYFAIVKKNVYNGAYNVNNLVTDKRLFIDLKLNNAFNNNIKLTDLSLMPIPPSLKIPLVNTAKPTTVIPPSMPVVPVVPGPRPAPAPTPSQGPISSPSPAASV